MKNSTQCLFVGISLVVTIACHKDTIPGTTASSTIPGSPFGVIVNNLGSGSNAIPTKIKVATQLKVTYIRAEINASTWSGSDTYFDAIINAQFKILGNINWASPSNGPIPFPTDLAAYKDKLTSILTKYQPEVVVIENEETNLSYHSGPIADYINELTTAIPIAHAKGLKITNGGITERVLTLLVWKDYLNQGLTAQATSFANRTIPPDIATDLPNLLNHQALNKQLKQADTLVAAYQKLAIDYVNFHWYEPVIQRGAGQNPPVVDTTHVDTQALGEVMTYLLKKTGKTPITNETGELHISPGIVTDVQQKHVDAKTPYVIWYSGDGTAGGVSLNNLDGSLRPNGTAFTNFITTHY